jgi:hypothetical protein
MILVLIFLIIVDSKFLQVAKIVFFQFHRKKSYFCRRFERGAFMAEIRPVEPDADNAAVGRQTLLFPNPSFSMFNY